MFFSSIIPSNQEMYIVHSQEERVDLHSSLLEMDNKEFAIQSFQEEAELRSEKNVKILQALWKNFDKRSLLIPLTIGFLCADIHSMLGGTFLQSLATSVITFTPMFLASKYHEEQHLNQRELYQGIYKSRIQRLIRNREEISLLLEGEIDTKYRKQLEMAHFRLQSTIKKYKTEIKNLLQEAVQSGYNPIAMSNEDLQELELLPPAISPLEKWNISLISSRLAKYSNLSLEDIPC